MIYCMKFVYGSGRNERVLITTLTKRMAEDLTEYYEDLDVRVRYMHSDVDVVERTKILHDLRAGEFDVLVGINLLREGLDLPEVSLVGIFDADKEGFFAFSTLTYSNLWTGLKKCQRTCHHVCRQNHCINTNYTRPHR